MKEDDARAVNVNDAGDIVLHICFFHRIVAASPKCPQRRAFSRTVITAGGGSLRRAGRTSQRRGMGKYEGASRDELDEI